jgi:hypothetical protein
MEEEEEDGLSFRSDCRQNANKNDELDNIFFDLGRSWFSVGTPHPALRRVTVLGKPMAMAGGGGAWPKNSLPLETELL